MLKLKQAFAALFLSSCFCLPGSVFAADKPVMQPAAVSPAALTSVPPASPVQAGAVNLNTADVVTLSRELYGVGDVKARAIVDYRASHGAFTSVDQLLEVQGIGMGILEKNRNKLTVN